MKRFFGLFLFSLLYCSHAFGAFNQASVNRNTIPFGESFMLTVETDVANPQKPDFSVLEKDFNIYSQGYISNVSFVNGKQSSTSGWQLILMPKQKGDFVIPAFDINGNLSQPINIKVVDAASAQENSSAPSFRMSAHVSNDSPYVQQELIYRVRLFDSGGLQGHAPTFSTSGDWIIRSLGNPEVHPMVVDGKKSREIVFSYALFPQKSGKLQVPTAHFDGFYLSKNKRNIDPFEKLFGDDIRSALLGDSDFFATKNPVRLSTDPIYIDVKPIPTQNNGEWWLPAKNVTLVQQWEPQNPKFKVGEAVNRTVYIRAEGVLDNQIPEINFAKISGMKQYPEKPESEMRVENGTVVSIAKISNVYIPSVAGQISLPPVEVKWFNVNSGKYEVTKLPAMNIEVEKGVLESDTVNNTDIIPEKQNIQTLPKSENIPEVSSQILTPESISKFNNTEIVILFLAAFAAGILICYILMKTRLTQEHKPNLKFYRQQIKKAALAKDVKKLRDMLLKWGKLKYATSKEISFSDLKKLSNDKNFASEIDKLSVLLYAENQNEWDAQTFLKTFEKVDKKKFNHKSESKLLPELYK